MDIDALASEFGSANTAPVAASNDSGVDVNALASEFGSKTSFGGTAKEKDKPLRVFINTAPAPPISGDTAPLPQPDVTTPGGPNPRDAALAEGIRNYVPSIAKAISTQASEGSNLVGEGLGDIVNQGQIKEGAKKVGLGALSTLTSIPSGIASEGVGKPITELTGNPDIGDRAAFVAGSAIPLAPGLSTVSKLRPSNVALKDLTDMITNNGANPENLVPVVQGMKKNSRLGPADLNPAVLSATQKLFTTEGDTAKNYLSSTSTNRMKTAPNAVKEAFDASTGLPVNAVEKLKSLAEASKKVGNEQINPAIAGAKPVDISGTLEHIDKVLKPGVNSVVTSGSTLPFPEVKGALSNFRKMLASPTEMRTGAQDIHDLQSALRTHAEKLLGSSTGKDRSLGDALMQVRNSLVRDIDKASPKIKDSEGNLIGSYAPALSAYRDEKHIAEAFHDAYSGVFSNSKKMENRPEFTRQWLDGLTPHELDAAKEGARLAIDTEIRSAKNAALAGQNIVKSDFNKEKLEMLFGKKEANTLIEKLNHERLIANTHNKVIEGSQTAMRGAAESKVDLPKPSNKSLLERAVFPVAAGALEAGNAYIGGQMGLGTVGLAASLAASKAGSFAKDKVKLALAKERNAQLAKLALPTQGPSRDALIQSLEAAIPGPKQSIVRRASRLSNLVGHP